MRLSRAYGSGRSLLFPAARSRLCPQAFGQLLFALFVLGALARSGHAQDTGTALTEFHGRGVALAVIVHGASGEPVGSSAVVKLFRSGTLPAGQAETDHGRAELVVNEVGDFTIEVEAAGYANAQKEIRIDAGGRVEVDVYLRSLAASPTAVPGRPVLAPKAKRAVDDGLRALGADDITAAKRQADKAMRLAPGHPDVLYLQGVVFLKERDWPKAQETLEKATQLDPAHASAFAALGMALCDQGKYEAAVAPLEKALQLDSAIPWDARWTLAKAYYQQARYDQALQMSQAALESSHGKAPEIELLVAQSLTAVGRYEDAAQELREFLREHGDRREAATARRWLDRLAANGKIHAR